MRLPFLWAAQNPINPDIQNPMSRCPKMGSKKRGSKENREAKQRIFYYSYSSPSQDSKRLRVEANIF